MKNAETNKTWFARAQAMADRAIEMTNDVLADARRALADPTRSMEFLPSKLDDGIYAEHKLALWTEWKSGIDDATKLGTPGEAALAGTKILRDRCEERLMRDTEHARMADHAQRRAAREFHRSMTRILVIAGQITERDQ